MKQGSKQASKAAIKQASQQASHAAIMQGDKQGHHTGATSPSVSIPPPPCTQWASVARQAGQNCRLSMVLILQFSFVFWIVIYIFFGSFFLFFEMLMRNQLDYVLIRNSAGALPQL